MMKTPQVRGSFLRRQCFTSFEVQWAAAEFKDTGGSPISRTYGKAGGRCCGHATRVFGNGSTTPPPGDSDSLQPSVARSEHHLA